MIPGSESSLGEGIVYPLQYSWDSLVAQLIKNPLVMRGPGLDPCVERIPWRRAWQPTPVFFPGESPWSEEPGRLQSTGSQRVRHDELLSTAPHKLVYSDNPLCTRPCAVLV